ncbi:MAG: peptidoglycan DD-metalloendopeptidase family protein, partial [Ruminococcus sp.]
LVGATDFFDFLSKYDMISRIAKHDNDLVNGLRDDITECNEKKEHLEKKKEELNVQLEEQEDAKEELKTAILDLQDDFEKSVEYSEMLKEKEALLNDDIADLESANKELEAEDARILAAILEAERKKKESEEAAKRTTTTAAKPVIKPTTTTVTKTQNNTGNGGVQTTKGTAQTQKTVQTQTTVKTQAPVQTTVQTTTPAPAPAPSTRFGWPCPGFYTLTSGFGPRWGRHHSGIDIAGGGISGAAAVASLSGTVIYVNSGCTHNYGKSSSCGCGGGYGNYVIVQHSGGYATVYAHLTSVAVSQGQSVSQGQTVGYVGSTGFSTGPHLHYEVRLNGTRVDPEKYLY